MCLCSHWILPMSPKVGKIFMLDALDINESSYKEFIICIQR
jgi:hypothetical protein